LCLIKIPKNSLKEQDLKLSEYNILCLNSEIFGKLEKFKHSAPDNRQYVIFMLFGRLKLNLQPLQHWLERRTIAAVDITDAINQPFLVRAPTKKLPNLNSAVALTTQKRGNGFPYENILACLSKPAMNARWN
jgi:hypothetical protein